MILTANGESNFDTPGGRCHFSRTLHFSWPSHLYYSRIRKSWKSYGCWRRNSGAKKSQKLKECYPKTPKRKKIGSSNQDFSPAMFVRRDIWLICFEGHPHWDSAVHYFQGPTMTKLSTSRFEPWPRNIPKFPNVSCPSSPGISMDVRWKPAKSCQFWGIRDYLFLYWKAWRDICLFNSGLTLRLFCSLAIVMFNSFYIGRCPCSPLYRSKVTWSMVCCHSPSHLVAITVAKRR